MCQEFPATTTVQGSSDWLTVALDCTLTAIFSINKTYACANEIEATDERLSGVPAASSQHQRAYGTALPSRYPGRARGRDTSQAQVQPRP